MMRVLFFLIVFLFGREALSAQMRPAPTLFFPVETDPRLDIFNTPSFQESFQQNPMRVSMDTIAQTSFIVEVGYVAAMETVFLGMSYLASRDAGSGPVIAGGFDLAMAIAGALNQPGDDLAIQRVGHYLISAGFLAKSIYNFRLGKDHSQGVRFWVNFIGFNTLVFTGYYLDTLD